jgi:hypothetical protein
MEKEVISFKKENTFLWEHLDKNENQKIAIATRCFLSKMKIIQV